jgi:GT2 family glycosyltransferase
MPLVSVIVPCFNAGARIDACLQSCLDQSHRDLQVIVVDNNSTDDSMERARAAAGRARGRLLITHCAEQGVGYARRCGFTLAEGAYVQNLDADDELDPDKIARQVEVLESEPAYAIAYGDWRWRFLSTGRRALEVEFRSSQFPDYLSQLLIDNWRPPHCYLIRRASLEGTDPPLRHRGPTRIAEDREFFTAAALAGLRFVHVPGAVVTYNAWSGAQRTRAIGQQARARELERIFADLRAAAARRRRNLSEVHRQLLEQSWALWRVAPRGAGAAANRDQVTPLEATLIALMSRYRAAHFLEHHARRLRRLLHQGRNARMARLPRELLEATTRIPDPEIIGEPAVVARFLQRGPLYLPMFATERLTLLTTLEKLCRSGRLEHAPPDWRREARSG